MSNKPQNFYHKEDTTGSPKSFLKGSYKYFFTVKYHVAIFFFKEQGGRSLQADGELVPGNTAN